MVSGFCGMESSLSCRSASHREQHHCAGLGAKKFSSATRKHMAALAVAMNCSEM